MKYFADVKTLDELKAEYRRLAMLHHPDRGGDLETMKAINAEHDSLFEILKRQHNAAADEWHQTTETAEEYRTIVDALLRIIGIKVELCGSWLWISGNTRQYKDKLKEIGCRWSNKKAMWYWHHAEDYSRYHRGQYTIDQIRAKYGSKILSQEADAEALPHGA